MRRPRHLIAIVPLALAMLLAPAMPAQAARSHPHRKPWPVTITVRTVPAVAGVRLSLDGRRLTTDARGRVAYTRTHNFSGHTLSLLDPSIDRPDRRYRFARWAGQRDPEKAYRTTVTGLPMRADYTVTLAFTVRYPVTLRYIDQNGRPLDLGRISSVRARSDHGALIDLPRTGTIWLDGLTPVYRSSTLDASEVSYSLQNITVDGANIVDAGRQRFRPATTSSVTFTGGFHDLTIRARDALFGLPIGGTAVIINPDGTATRLALGRSHQAEARHLPRGDYGVALSHAGGISLDQRLRLSRDKRVEVLVISEPDFATLGFAVLLVAAALLLAGRARWRRGAASFAVRVAVGAARRTRGLGSR